MRPPSPPGSERLPALLVASVLALVPAAACGGGSTGSPLGDPSANDTTSPGDTAFGGGTGSVTPDTTPDTTTGSTDPARDDSDTTGTDGPDAAGGPRAPDDVIEETAPTEEPCVAPAVNPCPNACGEGDVPDAGTCLTDESCACGLFCEFGKCRPLTGAQTDCACPDSADDPIEDPIEDPVGDPWADQCNWSTPNNSTCNPWCQLGCDAGQHCAIDGDHFGCVTAGGASPGATCESSADCVSGASCFGTVDDLKQTCRVPCVDEGFCPAPTTCSQLVSLSFALDVWFCAEPATTCQFWAQDCPATDGCVLVGGAQTCVTSTAEGGLGAGCTLISDCAAGLLCTGGACVQPCTTAVSPPPGAPLCTDCPNGHETVSIIYDIGRCQ